MIAKHLNPNPRSYEAGSGFKYHYNSPSTGGR
jgi:hypothetical protein